MTQKISNEAYLKRFGNMTAAEKDAYTERVGEWLEKQAPLLVPRAEDQSARFQGVLQVSLTWNDAECKAWTDGVVLLTAMVASGETWLPDILYATAARRTIRQMITVLENVCNKPAVAQQGTQQVAKEEPADKTRKGTQAVATFRDSAQGSHDAEGKPSDITATPVRPKHIDQYVHLLPESTQKKAATVQGLLRDLDVAREKMALLADDPKSSDDSRAQWAKTATKLDAKVKAIYKELDAEWDKLVAAGRVTVDDLGNAHVVDNNREQEQSDGLTAEQKAQIKSLRSWLRDTRGPKEAGEKHDAYVARWKEKYQEMVSLGGKDSVTEAVVKAAELYGIQLDDIHCAQDS